MPFLIGLSGLIHKGPGLTLCVPLLFVCSILVIGIFEANIQVDTLVLI